MIVFYSSSEMAMGRVQPSTQFEAGLFPGDKSTRRGTDHLNPSSARSRMRGAIRSLHHMFFWPLLGHLYLYVILFMLLCAHIQSRRNIAVCCDSFCTHDIVMARYGGSCPIGNYS
jgi:hypothetical protein